MNRAVARNSDVKKQQRKLTYVMDKNLCSNFETFYYSYTS